jgi:protein-S-isoprenylcysteine O-methyltransferase Ste14
MMNVTRLLMRIPVPWVFVLVYIISLIPQYFLKLKFKTHLAANIFLIAGIVIFLFAAILASWSLIIFHKARTTTTPGIKSVRLITNGPYHVSRNPMYISLILAYIGEAGLLNQLCPLILLPAAIFYVNNVVIPVEEGQLSKEFGEEYPDYQKRVPRWL